MSTIIQAESSHVTLIRAIAEKSWWPAYQEILPEGQIRFMLDTLYAEESILAQLRSGDQIYLLAFEKDKAVGFASFGNLLEDPSAGKLHKLYVLPEAQEKSWGRRLVDEVERRLIQSGKCALELNVNRHNKARSFYEKIGFSVAREVDIPIGNYWMNDYVMRKILLPKQKQD